jgi:uncharacterized membrane protein YhiD involved in acid resistance
MMTMPIEQAAMNLAVALGLGAAIGFERRWRHRLAGLRTNALVPLGSASSCCSSCSRPARRARPASPLSSSPELASWEGELAVVGGDAVGLVGDRHSRARR